MTEQEINNRFDWNKKETNTRIQTLQNRVLEQQREIARLQDRVRYLEHDMRNTPGVIMAMGVVFIVVIIMVGLYFTHVY